jgi:hypothetical protein
LIYAVLALQSLSILVWICRKTIEVGWFVERGGNVIGFLSPMLFIVFLRSLGNYIDQEGLARKALHVLILGCVLGCSVFLFFVMGEWLESIDLPVRFLIGACLLLLALVTVTQYGNILNSFKKSL